MIITGAGNAFTAGDDLKYFGDPALHQPDSPVLSFMQTLAAYDKPVIAAVNGLAVGIGVTLLLHCDLVYVADSASFSTPFTALGLVPEFASTLLFPMIAGRVRATEALLLGKPFLAAEAVVMGIANAVLPAAELMPHVQLVARKLAVLPPGSRAREQAPAETGAGSGGAGGDPARGRAVRAAARGRRGARGDRRDPREARARFLEVQLIRWPRRAMPRSRDCRWPSAGACAARGLMIATAESCTGGLLAKCLTDVAGSSDYFERGWVTYSNAAKQADLGVAPGLIEWHGAVSEEVAIAMAKGAIRRSGARVSIAVTGIAGPGGAAPRQAGRHGLDRLGPAAPRPDRVLRAPAPLPRRPGCGAPAGGRRGPRRPAYLLKGTHPLRTHPRGPHPVRLFFALWPSPSPSPGAGRRDRPGRRPGGRPARSGSQPARHPGVPRRGAGSHDSRNLVVVGGQGGYPAIELDFDRLEYWPKPKVLVAMASQVPPRESTSWTGSGSGSSRWVARETRPWRPHLTLVRKIRRPPPDGLSLDARPLPPAGDPARWGLALVESVTHPDGARYRPLAEWPLGFKGDASL